jgi:hypothetical protein
MHRFNQPTSMEPPLVIQMHQTVFPNLRRAVRLTFLNVNVSLTYDPFQASILLGFSRETKLTL